MRVDTARGLAKSVAAFLIAEAELAGAVDQGVVEADNATIVALADLYVASLERVRVLVDAGRRDLILDPLVAPPSPDDET